MICLCNYNYATNKINFKNYIHSPLLRVSSACAVGMGMVFIFRNTLCFSVTSPNKRVCFLEIGQEISSFLVPGIPVAGQKTEEASTDVCTLSDSTGIQTVQNATFSRETEGILNSAVWESNV